MVIGRLGRRGLGGIGGWPALLAARAREPAEQGRQQAGADAGADSAGDSPPEPPEQFEAFFREHERAVYACLWRLTGDAQSARDLTQETFLRAWRSFERVRAYEQPRAWLLRVATNLARSAHRRAPERPRSTDTLTEADEPARSDPTQRLAERDLVQRTLLALPPNQRAALTLREVYGLSCEEIGSALGISRDAVKMALFRGRESFRKRYLGKESSDER